MKYQNLINNCISFNKKANFIEPPPILLKEITNFVQQIYASKILAETNDPLIEEAARKYTNLQDSFNRFIKYINKFDNDEYKNELILKLHLKNY